MAIRVTRKKLFLPLLRMARPRHARALETGRSFATLETRQGLKVACPAETTFRSGWVSAERIGFQAAPMIKNGYWTQGEHVRATNRSVCKVAAGIWQGSPTHARWHAMNCTSKTTGNCGFAPGLNPGLLVAHHCADFRHKATADYAAHAEQCIR